VPGRQAAAAFGVYLLIAVAWSAPASLSPSDSVNDAGDPLHLAWTLAWNAHQLVRSPWSMFDANAFYPYPRSLAFSDHLLPHSLIAAPFIWTTGNAVLAYNLALVVTLASSGLAMWLLVRRATASAGSAFLAGLLFAFNSFTRDNVTLIHVVSLQGWPLALLFLDRWTVERRALDAWRFAFALALQGLSYSYYLLYTLLLAPLWVFVVGGRDGLHWSALRRLIAPVLTAALTVGAVVWPYLVQSHPRDSAVVSPREGWALFTGPTFVRGLGWTGVLLALAGAWRAVGAAAPSSARIGRAALATVVAAFVLYGAPLPPVGQLDLGGRAFAVLLLAGAMLAGLGARAALSRLSRRLRPAAMAVLAGVLAVEHWAPPRRAEPIPTGDAVPAVYRWLAAQSREPLVDLPLYPEVRKRRWAFYPYLSTYHWRSIPIGRTSLVPPAHDFLAWSLADFPSAASVEVLDRIGIRTVVVHPHVWPAAERGARLAELEAHPRLRLVRAFTDRPPARFSEWGLGEERVYDVLPATLATPCAPVDAVPREGWTLRASGIGARLARDGDLRTAWTTDGPQSSGDFFRVTLPAPEPVAAIAVDLAPERFGRGIVLDVKAGPDDPWQRVTYADGGAERWEALHALLADPPRARLILRFSPRRAIAFRLGLTQGPPSPSPWSVAELHAYRACR
jgi:hypothetical protein